MSKFEARQEFRGRVFGCRRHPDGSATIEVWKEMEGGKGAEESFRVEAPLPPAFEAGIIGATLHGVHDKVYCRNGKRDEVPWAMRTSHYRMRLLPAPVVIGAKTK